jgi:putative oxidoreductase
MFLMAGIGKIGGSQMHKEAFDKLQLPQWFRVVTGLVEFTGATLLIIGFWHITSGMAGALLLGVTAIGGILAHVKVKDSLKEAAPITILAVISFILLFLLI